MNNGIMIIHYIYLVSKHYSVNLIPAKTAFAETCRNFFLDEHWIWVLHLISFKMYVLYHIILKLTMFFDESETFRLKNVSLLIFDIPNDIISVCSYYRYGRKSLIKL